MPAKARDLFGRIASFPALLEAARIAARGKRAKPGVATFLANLEPQVLRLERELRSGRYRPGRYTVIEIRDPKRRIVSAAPFCDRVVHHAFCRVVEPLFERGFIHDSYANRRGKGTHRAIARYERFRDRHRWVLRCDIYRYFPAVDHQILKADLRRRLACRRTLALADRIIDASNRQEAVHLYYPGDNLFTPVGTPARFAHRQPDEPVLRQPVSERVGPLLQGSAAGEGLPTLRGRLRAVSRRARAARRVAATDRELPQGPAAAAAHSKDSGAGDCSTSSISGNDPASEWLPPIAGSERAPVPQPPAGTARPLARGHSGPGTDDSACARLDRACRACEYLALAPSDLPGGALRPRPGA